MSKNSRRILSNAAGVAFDLALKTECEMCSNTIKNLEAISDTLNNLQMNECAAGKSLVGIMADKDGFNSADTMKQKLGEAINYDKLSSGVSDMWTTLTTSQRSSEQCPECRGYAECHIGLQFRYHRDLSAGWTAPYQSRQQIGLPSAYTDLMRGLVGDVRLNIKAELQRQLCRAVSAEQPERPWGRRDGKDVF